MGSQRRPETFPFSLGCNNWLITMVTVMMMMMTKRSLLEGHG
jgi:hypothetical protein